RGDLDRKVTPVNITKPPSKVGAWIFKLVTLLVILGLIGLTLLWWQSRNGNELMEGLGLSDSVEVSPMDEQATDDTPPQPEPAAEEAESDDALPPLPEDNSELGLVDDQSANVGEASASSTDEADTNASEPASTTPSATAGTASVETTSSEAQATGEAAQTTATSDAADDAATEPETAEAQSAAQDETPSVDNRRLALTFNEQSWTEIYDANGQRIFVGLQSPGTEATVEGEPPFRLTVGNASGVELRYRGEPVDLRARAGGNNVARFTLGE
ncbi:DUF4115 domain-containing protein, partial [Halomonas sp. BBD48]|nr:DUF4115 domain-containing protein [Halomonas sp. BBD48]